MPKRPGKKAFTKKDLNHIREFGELHPTQFDEEGLESKILEKNVQVIDIEQEQGNQDQEYNKVKKLLENTVEVLPQQKYNTLVSMFAFSDEEESNKKLKLDDSDEDEVNNENDDEDEYDHDMEPSEHEYLHDRFADHFEEEHYESNCKLQWKELQKIPCGKSTLLYEAPNAMRTAKFSLTHFKNRLREPLETLLKKRSIEFDPTLYSYLANYQDAYLTNLTLDNHKEFSAMYTSHVLNHVMITRDKVLKNNERIKSDPNLDLRDQGFTRPKVLILLPFKSNAFRFVNDLIEISGITDVSNRKRFKDDFYAETPGSQKPLDYQYLFNGNTDDCFRMGIKFTRKSIKLYSEFYQSDIIVASPLGLRLITGSSNEEKRDFDFLSSIEVLVLDFAHCFTMQNWDHLQNVFKVLNKVPKEAHNCDFSRVRTFYLDEKASLFRQTLIFSSYNTPELQALYNKECRNVFGRVKTKMTYEGSISKIVGNVTQIYTRVPITSLVDSAEERFAHFTNALLPELARSGKTGILIYIPSYFDYVRIRNLFDAEEYSFEVLSEYSEPSEIGRARTMFHNKSLRFVLMTERFQFFRRIALRGIETLVFYGLPENGNFYSELINLIDRESMDALVHVMFDKYDKMKLERVLGSKRANKLIKSEREIQIYE